MCRLARKLDGLATSLLLAGVASAQPLPGTSAVAQPQLAGTIVEDVVVPFSYTGWIIDSSMPGTGPGGVSQVFREVTGTVQSRVVHAIDGTYDFYWRVTLTGGGLPIAGFTVTGLAGSTFGVDWRNDLGGFVRPSQADGAGDVAGWVFADPNAQWGTESVFLLVDTDARAYDSQGTFSMLTDKTRPGNVNLTLGGQSGDYATFSPALAPIPEPGTWALMLAGVVSLIALQARRRRPG